MFFTFDHQVQATAPYLCTLLIILEIYAQPRPVLSPLGHPRLCLFLAASFTLYHAPALAQAGGIFLGA